MSDPYIHATFRGETPERFLATRKPSIACSVAGGDRVKAIDMR